MMLQDFNVRADPFSYYERLQRVEQYVHENYCENLSLRQVARIAGLEEKYFSAYFHAKAGLCFKEWLTCVRLQKAMELMSRCDQTITSIGFAVGFQDLRTFERAFKKYASMTPFAFKKSVRPHGCDGSSFTKIAAKIKSSAEPADTVDCQDHLRSRPELVR